MVLRHQAFNRDNDDVRVLLSSALHNAFLRAVYWDDFVREERDDQPKNGSHVQVHLARYTMKQAQTIKYALSCALQPSAPCR